MQDLRKVSSLQLYSFWKNLSIGLLTIVGLMTFSILLPFYFSPIVALVSAAMLYTMLYNNKLSENSTCMVVSYALFFCLITYSFITIVMNILYIWGFIWLPPEFTFFSKPYIPSLVLCPICFVTLCLIYSRQKKLRICVDCRMQYGDSRERGKLGGILTYESRYQLRNLIVLFGVLSLVIWVYYLFIYVNTDVNTRDWYVFIWLTIIAFLLDEIYFIFRYYNLYLDLKENNEIISPEELRDMTAKTYLRFYVICGEYVYMTSKAADPKSSEFKPVIDTPFFTHRSVNGITISEVTDIIRRMTGVRDGMLRFFFGRKVKDLDRHSILRYFYFLDGNIEDYPELNVDGDWMKFDDLKKIYTYKPGELSGICVTDITRMATIMLTHKIFDERGFRRNKLKFYRPTFTLKEVKESKLDFQDDMWIRISMFNSDTPMYRVKRWMKNTLGSGRRVAEDQNANQWR